MKKYLSKSGFTLLELLIAASILMMIVMMGVRITTNVIIANTYTELRNEFHFELRYVMERIAREVQHNTIDYPEYYNYYVLNDGGYEFANNGDNFGSNYNVYGARFYNPGQKADLPGQQGVNTGGMTINANVGTPPTGSYANNTQEDLGTWCQTASGGTERVIKSPDCDGRPTLEYTEDFATGTNPFEGYPPMGSHMASAMCDATSDMHIYSYRQSCSSTGVEFHETDILFLMSPDGMRKTIISTEPWHICADAGCSTYEPGANVASILMMDGADLNSDSVNETWECADGFICDGDAPNFTLPAVDDLINEPEDYNQLYRNFMPFSSLDIDITDLRFYISPIEDPLKAYDEFTQQIQPHVTIVLTAEIVDPRGDFIHPEDRILTLQTTVSTQFYGEINSYLGTE